MKLNAVSNHVPLCVCILHGPRCITGEILVEVKCGFLTVLEVVSIGPSTTVVSGKFINSECSVQKPSSGLN